MKCFKMSARFSNSQNLISNIFIGWESVFYVMGGMSCTWCILWIVFVQDSPLQQPYIDQEERDMLVQALGTKPKEATKVIFFMMK